MTLRYRCPWCGSFSSPKGKDVREHILKAHRALLIHRLGLLESYGFRKPLDPPRNAAKRHHVHASGMPCHCDSPNPGVSGEGDSS